MFRGLVYCADCGKPLNRRHVYNRRQDGRVYYYSYLCPTTLQVKGACTPKNLKEQKLLDVVRDTIRSHLNAVAELDRRVSEIWEEKTAAIRADVSRKIAEVEHQLSRTMTLMEGLYQRLVDGIITRDEYFELKKHYQDQYCETKEHHQALKSREDEILRCGPGNSMFSVCRPQYEVSELSEELVHALIARIDVHDSNRLDIKLVYQDEFLAVARFLEGVTEP